MLKPASGSDALPPLVVGVDVGGSKIASALVDGRGNVSARVRLPTNVSSPEATLDSIAAAVRQSLSAAGQDGLLARSVGLGIPGLVDAERGIGLASVNLGWRDVAVCAGLQARLGLPCAIENDVRVAALGEARFGAGRGLESLVFLTIGTGIAAAAILAGKLYPGAHRLAGRVSPVSYIAVHDIDQMLWYHPQPVKSVYAKALRGRVWEELGTYDSAWMMIEFADGALGVHEVGWCLPEEWAKWGRPASWGGFGDVRMNVVGTHGVLNLDFTPMDLFGVDREGWKMPDTRHWPSMHGKLVGAAKLEVEHFFECVQTDQQPLINGEDGRRSLEVMLAVEKSIAEGRIITLPL